jgi:hypothetical protein
MSDPKTLDRPRDAPMTSKGAKRVLDRKDPEIDPKDVPIFKPTWKNAR